MARRYTNSSRPRRRYNHSPQPDPTPRFTDHRCVSSLLATRTSPHLLPSPFLAAAPSASTPRCGRRSADTVLIALLPNRIESESSRPCLALLSLLPAPARGTLSSLALYLEPSRLTGASDATAIASAPSRSSSLPLTGAFDATAIASAPARSHLTGAPDDNASLAHPYFYASTQ